MTPRPEDPARLVGDDDRDTAVRRLREAYAKGHLTHEEMGDRLDLVLAARTQGDLAAPLASLPEEDADTSSTIGALTGRIKRGGPWRVPRTLKVESAFGKVHLDLSEAIIEHPVVDIELQVGTGRAKITVPRDAIVEIDDLHTGLKDARYTPRRPTRPGGPKIRITGSMGLGRLKIHHSRR
ncbi:DUF1707 domain-containing protein [Actinomadura sp. WMMA1423]|uniref:DUF1707 SHOCT-like domain-containing protein n=1 Tax=Actinomadura sp. WMMA1423 TaxID=2591108 RepID=UPI00114738DF|nr:DUF1707 domain-containing protein [Actinomadura sp. WMMA1423]